MRSTRTRIPEMQDALPLALMVDAVWQDSYRSIISQQFWDDYPPAKRAEDIRESIKDPRQRGLVAVLDAALVGWAVRGPSRSGASGIEVARPSELYSLYVRKPGAGLGQRMLTELLGHDPAELWVFEANRDAQRFYERNGFHPDGVRHVYRPEGAAVPELRFVR